jgi:hypothetical protein
MASSRQVRTFTTIGFVVSYLLLCSCSYFVFPVPFITGPNNRANTTHWRVMKDPIRVTTRQITELHRLIKNRIAPANDPISPCKSDTAARPYDGDSTRVNVSRPLMQTNKAHYDSFCACQWDSHFQEDVNWCAISDENQRLFQQPYNFPTNGF